MNTPRFKKDLQYYKFCAYGFFKNLKFFEPFFILFFLDKGLNFLQIGALYAVKEIAINILEIPTGVVADALGRRRAMVTSFVSYIGAFLVFYFSDAYLFFLAAIFLYSLGDAMRTGTHKAMILEYLKINNWLDIKVKYYGNTRSWSQFGSAISSLVAALVVVLSGNYQLVFLVSIIPYLADLGLMISYPKILDGEIKKSHSFKFKDKFLEVFRQFKISFSHKKVWVSMMNISVYQGFFKSTKDYLQPMVVLAVSSLPVLLVENKESRVAILIGIIYFIIYLLSSFTSRNANKFLNLFRTQERTLNLTLLIGILVGLGSGLLVYFEIPIVAIIIFSSIFILQNIRKPVGTSLVADQIKSEIFATGLSIQSQLDSLFAALIALLVGALADSFGIGIAISSLSLLLMLGFVFLRIKR